MQIFARDQNRLLPPSEAEKGIDYACPECGSTVRLRSGKLRAAHFFHIKRSPSCRLASKGLAHLLLQEHLVSLMEGAEMEKPFPEIGRIADVCWGKTVYEIQVSPMSLEEAKSRTRDYESLGYQIVWILHEKTYNQTRLRPAEKFFRSKTCYFTNFDASGRGFIYDQLEEFHGRRRTSRSYRAPVDLCKAATLPKFKWPEPLHLRSHSWLLTHKGDFFDKALQGDRLPQKKRPPVLFRIKEGYLALLHMLLVKSST